MVSEYGLAKELTVCGNHYAGWQRQETVLSQSTVLDETLCQGLGHRNSQQTSVSRVVMTLARNSW